MATLEQIEYIINNYNTIRTFTIAKNIGLEARTVQRIADKYGLVDKKNKYIIDGDIVNMLCVTLKDEKIWFTFDKEYFDKVYNYGKWFLKKNKNKLYVVCNKLVDGKKTIVRLHRVILGLSNGDGIEVDHINGNSLDNRIKNIRLSDRLKNAGNMQGARQDNKSTGLLNITLDKRYGTYRPEIAINKNRIYFKHFKNIQDAEKLVKYVRAKYIESSQERFNLNKIIQDTPISLVEYADKTVLRKIGGIL